MKDDVGRIGHRKLGGCMRKEVCRGEHENWAELVRLESGPSDLDVTHPLELSKSTMAHLGTDEGGLNAAVADDLSGQGTQQGLPLVSGLAEAVHLAAVPLRRQFT